MRINEGREEGKEGCERGGGKVEKSDENEAEIREAREGDKLGRGGE